MPQLVGKALLAGLIPLGGLALHGFAASNGLIQKFEDLKADPLLSDGVTLYSTNYTSAEGFNGLLRTLLNFFWPVVNGNDARLSLYSFMFGGQGVALVMLNLLEGMRHGNRGLVVSFVTIYGLLYMVVGLAVMAPLYLLLHLLTSPTAHKPNKTNVAISGTSAQGAIFGTLAGQSHYR
ncbi:Epoxide hydrolase ascI [Emericellopsis cladophorae]|uniref:Epoxide hydrolase ascI n=1 Tax=Emericellopsis cladophorae TaxID=2686198 RepID=A0A9P9XZT6_9HYPO|nr:Epoxide hydrolase ascI [Emericellopsis cladophorae]KAI6780924.1 Epoxide hydrolase ascI [Emericellopsis cladophorae]